MSSIISIFKRNDSPIDPPVIKEFRLTSKVRINESLTSAENIQKLFSTSSTSLGRKHISQGLPLSTPNTGQDRPAWGRHLEFIVTCIGFAVGLGNIWRFPHLAYSNGGGVFLIPYTISLFVLGIPLFCLEILFGQFASLGPITIWEINPCFKGLGYTMVILSGIISIYYNVVVATAIFYFFASMQSQLPWSSCGNYWNTCSCRARNMTTELTDSLVWYHSNGLNCSGLNLSVLQVSSPSEEYFYRYVLNMSKGIHEPGKIKWDLTLCNLLAWIIICLCLIKGVSTMGKVQYFFALFPYVLLTVLLVRGVTLEGANEGIKYYLTPKIHKLYVAKVWQDAASQIFFSLSCCTGSLTAMASYNKFEDNVLRDSILIPIINCLTSFYAGFAIFSILGFMANTKGVDIEHVTTEGAGLVFVTYPEALSELPLPQIWSIAFFFMMICLGLGTQFPSVETVITALQDEFLFFRKPRVATIFRILVCALGFLLGIPMTTYGGYYVLQLLDTFVAIPLLLVGFFEIFAIIWLYGYRRFSEDVLLMFGHSSGTYCLFYWYYSWNWVFMTPVVLLAILTFDLVRYQPIISDAFPLWAEILGWTIVLLIVIWTPLWYIIKAVSLCRSQRNTGTRKTCCEMCREINQPTDKWGPRNSMDRLLERYQRIRSDASSGRSGLFINPPSFKSSTSSAYLPKANFAVRNSLAVSEPLYLYDDDLSQRN
ncbi:sodium-dependent proline transporter-like [Biomphalaria glabrata]|uniref:Sodium-dependent proline transporter-like n=1 Tax=Biomphalaria glabrata TaxID=6526 RepID=A0A9W2Z770_BIOGL|nr:sodium-dependent proline transporter-like [Biomphalaria glabrata]